MSHTICVLYESYSMTVIQAFGNLQFIIQKFDAPIKLVFPANIFDATSKSSMLGLGDIVIPGILVALMLRLDEHVSNYYITVNSHASKIQFFGLPLA